MPRNTDAKSPAPGIPAHAPDATLRQRAWPRRAPWLLALLAPIALAQSGSASYSLPRESIDAGAGRASSSTYTVHGTLGQPDAAASASSASFTVRGGFHRAGASAPPTDALFANGFEP
jgi:hypothetical protein